MRTEFNKISKKLTKLRVQNLWSKKREVLLKDGTQNKTGGDEMPKKPDIDKEMFKRSVLYNIKTLYRKTPEEATEQQIFQAVAYAVKDAIVDHWLKTQEAYEEKDPKTVYYMSMEFLMGRALGNNMINLMAYKEFSEDRKSVV